MPERKRNGHWTGLTDEEQAKVLSMLESNPSLVAQFVDAAQSGDILAAEALLAFGQDVIIIEDTEHPERTRVQRFKDNV